MTRLRLGTRGSALALWQANEVARLLAAAGYESELVTIRTTGDRRADVSLATIGGKGVFVKELEEALGRGEIDLAVHSLKDVPTMVPAPFILAGFLERGDPRDAWVHRHGTPIADLREGDVVGTSAPRRRAQLLARYPGLSIAPIRGNVDTRLRKVKDGTVDGLVLASAGLHRLGRESEATSFFSVEEMIPAAGQGVIALETLADHRHGRAAAAAVTHGQTEMLARSERRVLERFADRLDCHSAVAVHATISDDTVTIHAMVSDTNGARTVFSRHHDSDGYAAAVRVATELQQQGAVDLLRGATE